MNLLKKSYLALKEGILLKKIHNHILFTRKFYKVYDFFLSKKINPKKIVFANFLGRGYGCNPKYICEYIIDNNLDFDLVWLVDFRKNPNLKAFPKDVRIVNYFSLKAIKELATAGVWVDNTRKCWFPKKRKGQIYIQTWHGGFACKKVEADAPNLPVGYVEMAKKDSSVTDLVLSDSPINSDIFKKGYWYSGDVMECGTPRTDIFFDIEKIQSVSQKLRNFYKISENKKIILYAPTFRQSGSLEPYKINYEKVLLAIKEKFDGDWQFCIRLHPNVSEQSNLLNIPESVIDMSSYDDMQEILCATDILITDFSGIIFDYWFTNRPVFQFCTDLEDYTKNDREFYVDLKSLPFSLSRSNEELISNINEFSNEEYVESLTKFKNKYKVVSDGHASEKVVQRIMKMRETIQ